MTKNPLLLYFNNEPDQYSMIAGVENSGLLFSEAFTWDALRNWIVTTDVSGVVTVQMDFLAAPTINYLVLGAHRHDAAGFRFSGGSVGLQYWNGAAFVDCLATTAITAETNRPSIQEVAAHTVTVNGGYYSYQLTLSGLSITSDIALPELFLGDALVMPGIKYGYDPYLEEWTGPSQTTETGRIYESALSRRYSPKPKFNKLDSAKTVEVRAFIENTLEERAAFWFFYDPLNDAAHGLMCKHRGKTAPVRISQPNGITDFTLNMIESV